MKKFFSKVLIQAAGFDSLTALSHCADDALFRMKRNGRVLFVTVFFAMLGWAALGYVLSDNLVIAALFGIAGTIIVYIIDTGIMAGRQGAFTAGMFGRTVMAVCMGLVASESLLLIFFKDAVIEQQHTVLVAKQAEATKQFDAKIANLEQQQRASSDYLRELQKNYNAEQDGKLGGRKEGQGTIFKSKKADYDAYAKKDAKTQLNLATDIQKVTAERDAALAKVESTQATRLLGDVEALNEFAQHNTVTGFAVWVLRILLFFIEIMPLLLKWTKPSRYHEHYDVIVEQDLVVHAEAHAQSQKQWLEVKIQQEEVSATEERVLLYQRETQALLEGKAKDTHWLMARAMEVSEAKADFIAKTLKKIKDSALQEQVLAELDRAHEGYMAVLQQMIARSNGNFSTGTTS